MRISTPQFYAASLTGILNQQNTLNTLSQQLSTGSTLVNPSDQPVAAAQNVALTGRINRLANYTENGQNAQNSLQLESATVQSVTTLVSQVRQLAVQMNNGTVNSQDLQNAAAAMQGYTQQLAQYANTQDGQGNYLFAGSKSGTQPFVLQADGSVQYQGDGGQNQLALGPSLNTAISDPGNALFMNARAGNGTFTVDAASSNTGGATAGPGTVNDTALAQQTLMVDGTQYQISFSGSGGSMTYSVASGTGGTFSASPLASGAFTPGMSIGLPPGGSPAITVPIVGTPAAGDRFTVGAAAPQSLFQTFQALQQAFSSAQTQTSGSNALRAQSISNALASLDQNQTNLLSAQASIGSRLQQVQAVQTQNSSLTLQLQTQQTQLTSINYPQVITEYQSSLTALQAAQKAFVQVQGLSLFQYL
ncbi:MAG: flagellar hook-associated protein FlgL [Thiomonas sp.]|uniref:flagellar hook-associated protein FlgL n=1 Tax=Thiomonas sp. TaxID=2047785 RepID=UPI002A3660DD|nr:flagellar hook-associated protein FlgL [Thiomonas sp.]MDY0331389.1 flagellar hook-associated protein FlgL [Thiomonas sp.]